MKYCLENENETKRLEEQSLQKCYDVTEELSHIPIKEDSRILDAGCGSGLLSRFIADNYKVESIDACDFSPTRIAQAEDLSKDYQQIRFFVSDLANIKSLENKYDHIFCRYVFQHIISPQKVLAELKRVLKPGGKITIIETDGLAFDLVTSNKQLKNFLRMVKNSFSVNLYMGRELPKLLNNANYQNIDWDIAPMIFKGKCLQEEQKLLSTRFQHSEEEFCKILGSKTNYDHFVKLYLSEMMIPGNILFYNKFIVTGMK